MRVFIRISRVTGLCCTVFLFFLLGAPLGAAATDPYAWLENDPLAAACANFSARETEKLRAAGGLLEVRPIVVPRDEWLYKGADGKPMTHLGWPVAVKIDAVIHVFYARGFSHSRGPNPLADIRGAAVARSTDHGATFGPVSGLRGSCLDELGVCTGKVTQEIITRAPWLAENPLVDASGPAERMTNMQGGGGPVAAGVVDGKIVVATGRGVYRSEDNGETWRILEGAGMPAQVPTFPRWGQGPPLVVHPEHGLLSLGATDDGRLLIRNTLDAGVTWQEKVFTVGEPIQEPSGCLYEGRLILMPRTERAIGVPQPGARAYYQYVFDADLTRFERQETNILAGERDTTDVVYNPVSTRIEALVANRKGGGPGAEQDNCMTVNLWSIAPSELLAGVGTWRFDGTLLRTEGREHDRENPVNLERDGMCPGGSVVDAVRGVQYIYVYLGHFTGPTGIFQITRTLDTERLRGFLLQANHDPESEKTKSQ